MTKKKWDKENLVIACRNNYSYAGVARDLGIKPQGSNYRTIKKYIKEYSIDISHFDQGKSMKKYFSENPDKSRPGKKE